ncbi:PREDICTED: uncharacterized protein LOC107334838 isoform X2 [Acropora digitifera]|uniref:uncharacterized protein LOC107334838 isoform X2 n=1 Tax=Acropora digitifera TaxID=70779 RepID=UPI00077AEFDF|nr:PREDICTED: uncharacterized protein LOC107334838 isoform X2 [Acropora digitifera]
MEFSVPTLIFIVTRLLDGNNFSHFPSIRKGVMRKRPINKVAIVRFQYDGRKSDWLSFLRRRYPFGCIVFWGLTSLASQRCPC